MMGQERVKKLRRLKVFDVILIVLFIIFIAIFLIPILQLLAISFNDALDALDGGFYLFPRKFSLENYKVVLSNSMIYQAYFITILKTVIGTVASVFFTGMIAYGLGKQRLKFRKFYNLMIIFTMFFGGGLVPYALLIKSLGLYNNFMVYIIPTLINAWNMLIMKAFFSGIPESLEESARIDGYNDLQIFFKIIIPISGSIIATMALFNGVAQWNSWFDAYLYIDDQELLPLQTILVKMLDSVNAVPPALNEMVSKGQITVQAMRVTTMIISIGPIVFIYPLMQKHFVKGIMLGSIKG